MTAIIRYITDKVYNRPVILLTSRALKFKVMLSASGHWVDMNLYRATPVGTLGLRVCSLIQRTIRLSCLLGLDRLFYTGSQQDHYINKYLITWKVIYKQTKTHVFYYVLHVIVSFLNVSNLFYFNYIYIFIDMKPVWPVV